VGDAFSPVLRAGRGALRESDLLARSMAPPEATALPRERWAGAHGAA
jgi:hypothetical protein